MIEQSVEREKYLTVWLCKNSIWKAYSLSKILDLIHSLQDDKKDMHKDLIQAEKYAETLSIENAEQKAEIERLKDENRKNLFNSNTRICELDNEKDELQKQVDEQDKEIDRLEKVVHEQAEQYYDCEQRTAVEILQRGRYCMPSGLRDWIKERYGVEVE